MIRPRNFRTRLSPWPTATTKDAGARGHLTRTAWRWWHPFLLCAELKLGAHFLLHILEETSFWDIDFFHSVTGSEFFLIFYIYFVPFSLILWHTFSHPAKKKVHLLRRGSVSINHWEEARAAGRQITWLFIECLAYCVCVRVCAYCIFTIIIQFCSLWISANFELCERLFVYCIRHNKSNLLKCYCLTHSLGSGKDVLFEDCVYIHSVQTAQ